MVVRPLTSPAEFESYVEFAATVYRDTPWWVPADPHHMTALLAGQTPLAEHAAIQPFWVEDGGRILGTVTAVVDNLYNRHWRDRLGHLLSFEALPGEPEAVRTLLNAACAWLRERGCRSTRLSFLYGWQLPLTIDAYQLVPTVFHTLNPPYYHGYIKDAGFGTESGQAEYRVTFTPELATRYREMIADVSRQEVALRSWDFDEIDEEASLFADSYNEAFATHWGAPQFTLNEARALVTGLKDLLVADFTVFAEFGGTTIGTVFALPDLNQAFHAMGDSSPEGHPEAFAAALGAIDHGVLLSISVLSAFRGRGVNLAMAARSYLAMIDRGYRSASYTTVIDGNWPSRRTAEKLGGRIARNFVVYRRELA